MTEDTAIVVLEAPAPVVTTPAPLKMTYEEFLAWADEDTRRPEWVNGEVVFMGQVSRLHQEATRLICRDLSIRHDLLRISLVAGSENVLPLDATWKLVP